MILLGTRQGPNAAHFGAVQATHTWVVGSYSTYKQYAAMVYGQVKHTVQRAKGHGIFHISCAAPNLHLAWSLSSSSLLVPLSSASRQRLWYPYGAATYVRTQVGNLPSHK